MQRLLYSLFIACGALLFVFNNELLDVSGWLFSSDAGPFVTKLHPATYLLIPTFLLAFIAKPYVVLRTISNAPFALFLVAGVVLLWRAIFILSQGAGGGEVGAVITNFLMPALLLLVAACLPGADLARLNLPLRIFFAVNSLIALLERVFSHRLIPNYLDQTSDLRSTALVHHPLNGSLLTGLLIVYLVSARGNNASSPLRLGELALHAAAMFAFGGRAALVFTPLVLLLSSLTARNRAGEAQISLFQRSLPVLLVLIGVALVFMPIEFVDATLDRFTNDANSAEQRNSAIGMITSLASRDLLFGMDIYARMALVRSFDAAAIELAWIALTITYGLLATLPMLIALPLLIFTMSRQLDRSATFMGILFMVVTAGSLSIGVKSLLVCQFFLMILILCQPKRDQLTEMLRRAAQDRPRP